jgi:pimeloyl-ACP methyl ester carboxylesterase
LGIDAVVGNMQRGGSTSMKTYELDSVELHKDTLRYVDIGDGPPVILVHGLLGSHMSWAGQIERLSERYRVIAPDLFGHGSSDKPSGDYSLSSHAATIRDLLDHLGIDSAPMVGHSLGGGIVMQTVYLFPERVDCLALVSSGGLGPEVSLLLKAGASMAETWRSFQTVADKGSRGAFLASTRAVVGPRGQTVSAKQHFAKFETMPSLLIWGSKDRMIPASHADNIRREVPNSRVEIFPSAGHFPQLDEPDLFFRILDEFLSSNRPADAH